jgi:hypothetical protein
MTLHPKFTELHGRSQALNERNDCAPKAIALVTGVDYNLVLAIFKKRGRRSRCATQPAVTFGSLGDLGFKSTRMRTMDRLDLIDRLSREFNYNVQHLTTRQLVLFPLLDPTKTYLIETRGHIAAYVKGELIDWTETRANRITEIHEITPINP